MERIAQLFGLPQSDRRTTVEDLPSFGVCVQLEANGFVERPTLRTIGSDADMLDQDRIYFRRYHESPYPMTASGAIFSGSLSLL